MEPMGEGATGRDPVPGRIVRLMEVAARHGAALEVPRGLALDEIPFSFNFFMQWPHRPTPMRLVLYEPPPGSGG